MKDIVEIARQWSHVREREGAQNEGLRVEAIQKFSGGRAGDPWCAFMVSVWLDLAFSGKIPFAKRSGSCDDFLNEARAKGWLADKPHVADLYLFMRGDNDAHHIGLVTDVDATGFTGISGNTSEDGLSSNGNGVYERRLELKPGKHLFIRYPR